MADRGKRSDLPAWQAARALRETVMLHTRDEFARLREQVEIMAALRRAQEAQSRDAQAPG